MKGRDWKTIATIYHVLNCVKNCKLQLNIKWCCKKISILTRGCIGSEKLQIRTREDVIRMREKLSTLSSKEYHIQLKHNLTLTSTWKAYCMLLVKVGPLLQWRYEKLTCYHMQFWCLLSVFIINVVNVINNHQLTFDNWMPLNVCDCFFLAILKISKWLVFLSKFVSKCSLHSQFHCVKCNDFIKTIKRFLNEISYQQPHFIINSIYCASSTWIWMKWNNINNRLWVMVLW